MQISWPLTCHRRVSPPPVFMGMVWEEEGCDQQYSWWCMEGGVAKGME